MESCPSLFDHCLLLLRGVHSVEVARPNYIELGDKRSSIRIPILYEDRSVIAIDKPAGWLLVPFSWQRTSRNLQAAITSSIAAGDFWARSRNLRFLRHVHRLDGETSGLLLMAKSQGALDSYADLFENRRMEKAYLAVVKGVPERDQWIRRDKLGRAPKQIGRMRVDQKEGKPAETSFRLLASREGKSLLEARPVTGRTHQIRVHLLASGHPIVGDRLYGPDSGRHSSRGARQNAALGLRAVGLAYIDPFRRESVRIEAPAQAFLKRFGFGHFSYAGTATEPPAPPGASSEETERPGTRPA